MINSKIIVVVAIISVASCGSNGVAAGLGGGKINRVGISSHGNHVGGGNGAGRSGSAMTGSGVNVKGLKIMPSITLSEEYTDNIALSQTQKQASWVTVVSPAFQATSGTDSRSVTVFYDLERGADSAKNNSYIDQSAGGSVHAEFTSRATFDTAVAYSKSHDDRGTTFTGLVTGFNTPDKWHESSIDTQFSYGGKNARGRISFVAGYSMRRYENHRSLTASRDLNTANAGTTFYYKIMPKTSALIEADYTSLDYRLAGSLLDSHEVSVLVGLTWEATGKTNGEVKLGWQRKKFNQGTQAASNNLSWDILMDWAPMTYSTWTLSSGYQANETEGTGSFIKTIDVNLAWKHAWSRRLQHIVELGYTHDQFVGTVRKDNGIQSSIGLSYAFAPWLDVSTTYDYSKRSSNIGRADFTQNIYAVTLTGAL